MKRRAIGWAWILLLLAGGGWSLPARAGVIVSEFMASNDRTLKDDFGDDADWIEICNTGTEAVDVAGWRLTDDAGNLSKWIFPSRTLAAGEYLLVYATNRDRKLPGTPLHTNFKLSDGGEYLALVRPDGVIASEFSPAFPPQVTDISYGFPQNQTVTAAAQGAAGQAGVPVSQEDYTANFAGWTTRLTAMTGTSWQDIQTGVGYDDPNAPYGVWIATAGELSVRLKNQQRTACLRVPFQITDPAEVLSLRLLMRWDDGFIAYVNGVEVARDAAPATPAWNSLATQNRNEALNNSWTTNTIAPASVPLLTGTNILAIQGFNLSATSSDFLLLPLLQVVYSSAAATPTYFTTPTPGAANGLGGPIGPALTGATASLPRPTGTSSSPAAVVSVTVAPTVFPVAPATVKLVYRTMFASETPVVLADNGLAPDALAGDGVYTGTLPTTGPSAGQMLRWRFEAADTQGNIGRAPLYRDATDFDQYYGTVARNADEATSSLPVVHQFIESPAAADTQAGTRGAIFYLDRFYDNVLISLHGQTTSGFAKKSHNYDFNSGNRFLWSATLGLLVKDVDILSNYADKTRTRNTLAHETSKLAGGTHHFAFPVRVQLNGAFYGVLDMMEDGDDRMLERNGLDPYGALYKMYDALENAGTAEKKTRQDEDTSDLQALIAGLNPATALDTRLVYAYDNVNLAATINYLATRQLITDLDHGHKNYYLYRDTLGTREWRPIIWDVDLSFGHRWISNYFDDTILATNSLRATMTTGNRLYKLIAEAPELRAMYVRRFRTLMDDILKPPGATNTVLETRMREIVASVDPDAAEPSAWTDGDRDFTQWGTWGRGLRPRPEVEYVIAQYFQPRRVFLYNQDAATRDRFGVTAGAGDPIPDHAQTNDPGMVIFDSLDFNPASGTQAGEYLVLRNTTAAAVDLSGWTLSGGVAYTFPGGTVIPSGDGTAGSNYQGLLHVVRDAYGFRQRTTGPTGGQRRFVQGNYSGQLSAWGETVDLRDPAGQLIARMTYAGNPTAHQRFLRITEIQYHPAPITAAEQAALPGATGDDFEFLELTNLGGDPLSLGGAAFTQGITFTFPETSLAAGARLILAKNPAAFAVRHPGVGVPVLGPYDGQLDNGGERLELTDPVGEVILDFEYKDGWFPATDGTGRTLALRDEATNHDDFGNAVSWAISADTGGSPGMGDLVFAQAYYGWDNDHFTEVERETPAVGGPLADPDGDGRLNWQEYALGTNPRLPDAAPAAAFAWSAGGPARRPGLRMIRRARALDLAFELAAAADLRVPRDEWPVAAATASATEASGKEMEYAFYAYDETPLPIRRFFGLRIRYVP